MHKIHQWDFFFNSELYPIIKARILFMLNRSKYGFLECILTRMQYFFKVHSSTVVTLKSNF